MASTRRSTSYSSPTQSEEVIDALSNISEKEVEVVEEIQAPVLPVEVLLPEIIPTEAPLPHVEKKVVEFVSATPSNQESAPPLAVPPKRHPRNIPKFSSKRT